MTTKKFIVNEKIELSVYRVLCYMMENYFKNMNTRVPSEPILLLTHEFEKVSIH